MPANFTDCIENFLGPEISGSPVVLGSKLNNDERNNLDRFLGIEELNESVKKLIIQWPEIL